MRVFEKPGPINTDETCRIGIDRAVLLRAPIVSATTEGASGARVCEIAKELGYQGDIIIVTHAYGSKEPGINAMNDEDRKSLIAYGARLVTAAHALSGAERGISTRFQGAYPVEIIAHTLRMLSHGIKVAVEIGCIALDAGEISYGSEIVCMGGTGHGLDTAVVMTPAHANRIFETKIHEILCMPK